MNRRTMIVSGLAVVLGGTAWSQVTQRVSISTSGAQANDNSHACSVSADLRYVAFSSFATNLLFGDTNGFEDVFVRDRQTGTTERVSVDSTGTQGNGGSSLASISADGRYVAFVSSASNLVSGDTNALDDVFVHDRQTGTTERVSVDSTGAESDGDSLEPSISADGRFVAFLSNATNLVAADSNNFGDILVHDRQSSTTERVSVDSAGAQSDGNSLRPSISADGRYVAFLSHATNLVAADSNAFGDVFVRDRQSSTTERVSVDTAGIQGNGDSSLSLALSADGRFVAFQSAATNLLASDTNVFDDVFVRDRQSSTTERVSVDSTGTQANGHSLEPAISADGRFVTFESDATNLVLGDTNTSGDIFVHDRQNSTTGRASVDSGGVQGNGLSVAPSISGNGRYVAYESVATNLDPADTNGTSDIFVRDQLGGTTFTSVCEPGVGGVTACPCSNPPSGAGRGCNNSASTGGAILSASGGTYISSDSLVFTTTGELPAELSLVIQGKVFAANGLVFGQGVRCVGGKLLRLYVKTASAGGITAPNFGAGDPTVSDRSHAKGDTIQSGQSRWYFVYYRDLSVLGGCPASSLFNATQGGEVVWSP